jgi:hypothetical protein
MKPLYLFRIIINFASASGSTPRKIISLGSSVNAVMNIVSIKGEFDKKFFGNKRSCYIFMAYTVYAFPSETGR